MVTWICKKLRLARMSTCHAKAMYYGGWRIMLLLLATIMPKENEADIAVLVSRTERAQDGETMVALTVRDARKWRISSQANCWFRVSPKASPCKPCKPRDKRGIKGEADFRRARSSHRLLDYCKRYLSWPGPHTSAAF